MFQLETNSERGCFEPAWIHRTSYLIHAKQSANSADRSCGLPFLNL
jgi:hypothetical protein